MNHCERCDLDYYYDERHHVCPEVWEATHGRLSNPYAGMTWVEECMAKQAGGAVR